jgi:hypothetical protein
MPNASFTGTYLQACPDKTTHEPAHFSVANQPIYDNHQDCLQEAILVTYNTVFIQMTGLKKPRQSTI